MHLNRDLDLQSCSAAATRIGVEVSHREIERSLQSYVTFLGGMGPCERTAATRRIPEIKLGMNGIKPFAADIKKANFATRLRASVTGVQSYKLCVIVRIYTMLVGQNCFHIHAVTSRDSALCFSSCVMMPRCLCFIPRAARPPLCTVRLLP